MSTCSLCLTQISNHAAFCHRCSDSLRNTTPRCHSCGIELATSNTHCGECLSHPPEFDRTLVAARYAPPIDQLIHQFKYNGDLRKGRILTEWLNSTLPQSKPDLLIPMPLSPARLQERGFNQSAELARLLSQRCQIPVSYDLLKRHNSETQQIHLKRKERLSAMRKVFYTDQQIKVRSVSLIDDVVTTTATARAAARVLKKAGVKEVIIWAVARTPRPNDKD
jgi:ComF family protein